MFFFSESCYLPKKAKEKYYNTKCNLLTIQYQYYYFKWKSVTKIKIKIL